MDTHEIVSGFNNAANPRAQIEILAQLNDCKPRDIVQVLVDSPEVDNRVIGKKYLDLLEPRDKRKEANPNRTSEILNRINNLRKEIAQYEAELQEIHALIHKALGLDED